MHEKLKEYFGFSSFKGNQEAVIRNVLAGRDTFVLIVPIVIVEYCVSDRQTGL